MRGTAGKGSLRNSLRFSYFPMRPLCRLFGLLHLGNRSDTRESRRAKLNKAHIFSPGANSPSEFRLLDHPFQNCKRVVNECALCGKTSHSHGLFVPREIPRKDFHLEANQRLFVKIRGSHPLSCFLRGCSLCFHICIENYHKVVLNPRRLGLMEGHKRKSREFLGVNDARHF